MNDERVERLFRAARGARTDTARVELGFETRLMARIRAQRAEPWFAWAWRLAPVFAAVVVALGAWNYASGPVDLTTALAGHSEDALFASTLAGGAR
jgi:hypothetical protein